MGEVGGDFPGPQFISESRVLSYCFFISLGVWPELIAMVTSHDITKARGQQTCVFSFSFSPSLSNSI